jgi:prepilin-type processing-associated H-X9-DG protein
MYANESKGMKFPPLQVIGSAADNFDIAVAAGPSVVAIYPEYLTDANIMICPSDSEADNSRKKLADHNGNLAEIPDEIDASYAYFGWMFDHAKKSARSSQFLALSILVQFGGSIAGDPWVPVQIGAALDGLIESNNGRLPEIIANGPNSGYVLESVLDNDTKVGANWVGQGAGNGGGDTVYRLREGVERFCITDINNPAATAKAQSSMFIMGDTLGAGQSTILFNHIPGGCNVLFMDGHVEWARYIPVQVDSIGDAVSVERAMGDGIDPVLPTVAALIGAFGTN